MKYFIFWTTLLTAILANVIHWYHPATFSLNTLTLLWLVCFTIAFFIITEKRPYKSPIDPKRILHICLFYPPASHDLAVVIENFVAQTRAMKDKPDVRVLTSKLDNNLDYINPDKLLSDPMYVQRLHHLKLPLIKTPYLQALSYYISHHKPDFIYVHGKHWQLILTAKRYGQRHNIPVVINSELE